MRNQAPIYQFMENPNSVVNPNDNLQLVYNKLQQTQSEYIMVTQGNKVKGVIERNTVEGLRPGTRSSTPAKNVMNKQFIFLSPEDKISEAWEILKMGLFKIIPIINQENQLVGTISLNNILSGRKNFFGRKVRLLVASN